LGWGNAISTSSQIAPNISKLRQQSARPAGEAPLAPVTQKKIIEAGKRFFIWAKQNHPKEFGHLTTTWLESLRPPRIRESSNEHEYVSLEEVLQLIAVPQEDDDLALLRDQAAAAMLFLSGMPGRAPSPPCPSQQSICRAGTAVARIRGVATRMASAPQPILLPIPELLIVAQTWDQIVRSKIAGYCPLVCSYLCIRWGESEATRKSPRERIATRRWINV
jgi:hypothetical protein